MRLIQFNSGLRVVLKDVQQQQTEPPPPRYYLAPPLPPPAHHSSNTSIATTSSSSKSNISINTNHEYYIHRQYLSSTHSTNCQTSNPVKTPPVLNPIPSSTLTVEVGLS